MIEMLKSNLAQIRSRMDDAARKSGRSPDDVCLVGVTKYVDAETARALVESGCTNLGESRPQTLWEKAVALEDLNVRWHMIGHLQRNKVRRTVECCDLIHSVDSLRLMKSIDTVGQETDKTIDVLLEVNVSGESAKHGFKAAELEGVVESVAGLDHVSVKGLMCMAGLAGGVDEARREFAMLRELGDQLKSGTLDNIDLKELSMGMSGDFEIAIEEGATMVRVGSLLFDGV
jgi:pyridoxal phosphate enzyme (YggS family)